MKLTLTCAEAAKVLGLSAQSVRKLVEDGRLPRLSEFRHVVLPASGVLKYLGLPADARSAQQLVESLTPQSHATPNS